MSNPNAPAVADFSSNTAWQGESPSRTDPTTKRSPSGDDYNQIVAEVAAVETDILGRRFKSLINDNGSTIVIGAPVYLKSTAGHCDLAKADAASTGTVFGLVADTSILTTVAGKVQTEGEITLTTAQWDTICGTSGGLAAGTVYYLSAATAGKLTSTAPSAASSVSETVIIGESATVAKIKIGAALVVHA